MKSILFLIPYFGKFPEWAPLFFETLKSNPSIDFFFFTDCEIEPFKAKNINYQKVTFDEYVELVNQKLDFQFAPPNAYKLCDLRPLFGYIHENIFKGYDFYGWVDMDLLLGDIRSFYSDELFEKYDVFSTHKHRISGHLAIFRNNKRNKLLFRQIYKWREMLKEKKFIGIDEHGITNAYQMTIFDKFNEKFNLKINNFLTRWASKRRKKKLYMVEQFTSPFTPIPWLDGSINSQQPNEWYYKNGWITNNRDGKRNFPYIHFMNFKSSQWRHDGTKAPWEGKKRICFASPADMTKGIIINSEGIHPI